MKIKYQPYGCPIRYGLGSFGDKWTLLIIRDLMFKGKHSYGEFQSGEEGISTNILADRLKELECNEIVTKSPDPEHGKKFIYELTEKGQDLMPVMLAIMVWAEKHDEYTAVPESFMSQISEGPTGFQLSPSGQG